MTADRVPTGIRGLDQLIGGGFPRNSLNLISGPAGSGKSLFSLQFLANGARLYGEAGVYLALEEGRASVRRAAAEFGLDFDAAGGALHVVDLGEIRGRGGAGAVGFGEVRDFLRAFLEASKVHRLVVDSLPVLGLSYRSPEALREELFGFARFLREQDVTSLTITESLEDAALTRYGVEQFVADSFIVLALEKVKGELRRTVTVRKMRFTKHDTGTHPFFITPHGVEVSAEERVIA